MVDESAVVSTVVADETTVGATAPKKELGERKVYAGRGELSPGLKRYVALRAAGLEPIRAVQMIDQENDHRRGPKRQQYLAKQWEEATSSHRDYVPPDDMTDEEFDRYYNSALEKVVLYPKESAAFALTALDKIKATRKERRLRDEESVFAWLDECLADLEKLASLEVWAQGRAGREAHHTASENAPEHNGGPGAEKSGIRANLGLLVRVLTQEERLTERLQRAVGHLRDTESALTA